MARITKDHCSTVVGAAEVSIEEASASGAGEPEGVKKAAQTVKRAALAFRKRQYGKAERLASEAMGQAFP